MKVSTLSFFTLAAFAALGTPLASASSVTPMVVYGNKTCKDLGYSEEHKLEFPLYPAGGSTYKTDGGDITVTTDGTKLDWTSSFGIDAVLVKGGTDENHYAYDPKEESYGDKELNSPTNPKNGYPYGISHVSFCYDHNLIVYKTAYPSLYRTWEWAIDKYEKYYTDYLLLMPGETRLVNYIVKVFTKGAPVDSKWAVSGEITIKNPSSTLDALITSVTDIVTPGYYEMKVECPGTGLPEYPHKLAAGYTLKCKYSGYLPDGEYRTNTAKVESKYIEGGSGTAPVDFTKASVTAVDKCVTATDTYAGALGYVCADKAPATFYYDRYIGPFYGDMCYEDIVVYNKASFETYDTKTTGFDTWDIKVELECDKGCTLTQGYWKTHSSHGPAPKDDAWLNIGPKGADTYFFISGKTWYEVFGTPPAGNAYYNLAHQYMAAKLNILNGASSTPAVDAAIAGAEGFFTVNAPNVSIDKALKTKLLGWATTLDQYNNGMTGPGHCD